MQVNTYSVEKHLASSNTVDICGGVSVLFNSI
jgi:hypothetical protein